MWWTKLRVSHPWCSSADDKGFPRLTSAFRLLWQRGLWPMDRRLSRPWLAKGHNTSRQHLVPTANGRFTAIYSGFLILDGTQNSSEGRDVVKKKKKRTRLETWRYAECIDQRTHIKRSLHETRTLKDTSMIYVCVAVTDKIMLAVLEEFLMYWSHQTKKLEYRKGTNHRNHTVAGCSELLSVSIKRVLSLVIRLFFCCYCFFEIISYCSYCYYGFVQTIGYFSAVII